MNLRNGLVLACIALMLAACAATPDEQPEPVGYEVWQEADHIIYRGLMLEEAVEEVAQLLRQHGNSINWLAIESPGGDVMIGMDLGELVHEHDLNVKVVNTGCHSSCANYVFTAGRLKVIEEGATVTWHGSALQHSLRTATRVQRRATPSPRRLLNRIKARQKEFFERIGVDARITIVGQDLNCRCVWALSADDMARFGLENIEVPDNYSEIVAAEAETSRYMRLLSLPDDVFERIRPPEDA